jgi:uncharacterized Rossmann fold enzyme
MAASNPMNVQDAIAFVHAHGDAYEQLDQRCATLTTDERSVGQFKERGE